MTLRKPGKYFEIILSVALFLVLDACILGINYLTSFEISDDGHALQLASRQTRLSQQLVSELYVVRDHLQANQDIEQPVLQLTQTFRQFDEVLDSFIYGGELIGVGQGQDSLLVDSDYAQVNMQLLKQIEALWRPYRARISPVIYSIYSENLDREKILEKTSVAIAVARETNSQLLALLNEFSAAVESLGKSKVERLQFIQAIGIAIAVVYFFVLLFYFVRKLSNSDRAAEIARGETVEILATVNEGLFLLDKNMRVGSQYSASLCAMLNLKQVAGANFIEMISPMVSGKTLRTTRDFLDAMFADHVDTSLIQDLNPLDQVEMQISDADGKHQTHHFRFRFSAVEEHGRLVHVLVSIVDVSDRIHLEAELAQSRQQSSQQLDLLLSVIHIQPELLSSGLSTTEQGLLAINELLKEPASNEQQFLKKHRDIGRIAHRIKGDCAAIELHSIASDIHSLEDELQKIAEKAGISGNDFLPLVVKLNQIHQKIHSVRSAIARIANLQTAVEAEKSVTRQFAKTQKDSLKKTGQEAKPVQFSSSEAKVEKLPNKENWASMISRLAEGIASQYGKQLRVDLDALDFEQIPEQRFARIKDVLVQLVRNAAVHGIEQPEIRRLNGKGSQGSIRIYSATDAKGTYICVRDDGRGIHLDEIRAQLIDSETMTEQQIEALDARQLMSILFKPGFSTANGVDMNAGRGIGLDLVKSSLDQCGARLALNFKPGRYTEFKIRLPEPNEKGSTEAMA